jgi:predicted nucleic acid-binding Zn ribbon protein
MPICKKCEKKFPYLLKINGKIKSLRNRKYCLECSPFGQHNTSKIHLNGTDRNIINGRYLISHQCICTQCGRKYQFVSNNKQGHTLTKCNSCCVNRKKKQTKQKAIDYKGGMCNICGYKKSVDALEFHHIDRSNKDFSLSGNYCHSWHKIKKELDKCICVCSNCHREIHADMISDEKIQKVYKENIYKDGFDVILKIPVPKKCPVCNKDFFKKTRYCSDRCSKITRRKVKDRPSKEQLLKEIEETNYTAVGRKYGVNGNTIKKWLK